MATNALAPKPVNMLNKVQRSGEGSQLRQQYPKFYGLLGGLLGTAPDEFEGSVMDPLTAEVRKGAEVGFPVGVAAMVAPFGGGVAAGKGVVQGGKAAQKGIIGYHGTDKVFKNFAASKGKAGSDITHVGTMNKVGPHFSENPEIVNEFIRNTPGMSSSAVNIRRADIPMQKAFDVGSEEFFHVISHVNSWDDFIKYSDDMKKFAGNKDMIESIIKKNQRAFTSGDIAKNIRETLSEHGFDGIKYTGDLPDIKGQQAFIPFNVKNIKPSWGNAPTKYPAK